MRTFLAIAVFATAATAQLPITATAHVNDPLSRGTLGDNLLSLEEAIRYMNQEPGVWTSFSAAEQAQVTWPPCGTGPCPPPVERIEIDASVTPVITMEGQFPILVGDNVFHVCADVVSVNGRCVIDATGTAPGSAAPGVVFPTSTNHFHLSNFIVRGGGTGVTNDSAQHYHPGVRMFVKNCVFEDQTVMGIQLAGFGFILPQQPGDLMRTVIRNAPVGIEILDDANSFGSQIDVGVYDVTVENCGVGLRVDCKGFNGSVNVNVERVDISGATTGIQVRRENPLQHNAVVTMSLQHVNADASGSAFDAQGHGIASTALTLAGVALTGATAFSATPATACFDIDMVDTVLDGTVVAQTSPTSSVLRMHDCCLSNGPVTLAASGSAGTGATPDIFRCRFENAPVTIPSGHTKPFTITDSEFHTSAIQNSSSVAVDLSGCFQAASPVTNVTVTNPVPTAWMAKATVTPNKPARGGIVTLDIDLPPNMAALWVLGVPLNTPLVVGTSRYWVDPASPVIGGALAGIATSLQLPIPRSRSLRNKSVYAQPLTLYYDLAQGAFPHPSYIPFLLPRRGGLITIQ